MSFRTGDFVKVKVEQAGGRYGTFDCPVCRDGLVDYKFTGAIGVCRNCDVTYVLTYGAPDLVDADQGKFGPHWMTLQVELPTGNALINIPASVLAPLTFHSWYEPPEQSDAYALDPDIVEVACSPPQLPDAEFAAIRDEIPIADKWAENYRSSLVQFYLAVQKAWTEHGQRTDPRDLADTWLQQRD